MVVSEPSRSQSRVKGGDVNDNKLRPTITKYALLNPICGCIQWDEQSHRVWDEQSQGRRTVPGEPSWGEHSLARTVSGTNSHWDEQARSRYDMRISKKTLQLKNTKHLHYHPIYKVMVVCVVKLVSTFIFDRMWSCNISNRRC